MFLYNSRNIQAVLFVCLCILVVDTGMGVVGNTYATSMCLLN